MMHPTSPRGFTLLIALVLTTVLLSVGFALVDIAYKQVVLSSTAKQSQLAFYAADSALECALYWDQQHNVFAFGNNSVNSIECDETDITFTSDVQGQVRESTFTVPCAGGGAAASVTIYKANGGNACGGGTSSCLYSYGYSSCDPSDPRRVERGLKVFY